MRKRPGALVAIGASLVTNYGTPTPHDLGPEIIEWLNKPWEETETTKKPGDPSQDAEFMQDIWKRVGRFRERRNRTTTLSD